MNKYQYKLTHSISNSNHTLLTNPNLKPTHQNIPIKSIVKQSSSKNLQKTRNIPNTHE
jgi:hypothetical protein